MTQQTHTIAESNNFIVLDKFTKILETGDSYQSESDLERELIQDFLIRAMNFISSHHSCDAGECAGPASAS
jgi:type I restriction enzyme R subunit